MSKTFADYGLSSGEFEGLDLEDPALFDSFVIRMVEDLDLSTQVTAGLRLPDGIVRPVELDRAFRALDIINRPDRKSLRSITSEMPTSNATEGLRSYIHPVVRAYLRGPLDYDPESLDLMINVVTAVAYDALSTGAREAREHDTRTVQLRHWLPACQRWLYPLNRFC